MSRNRSAMPWVVLRLLILGGFGVRLAAAAVVERVARRNHALCLFDDTKIYWELAGALRFGSAYEVIQYGVPHRAVRTPGYPLFLAACRVLFGASNTMAPRVVQAALGAACVGLVYAIVRAVWPEARPKVALIAAGLAAFEPYWAVATSPLLLSEAVFVPLMLAMIWGVARLWSPDRAGAWFWVAIGAGWAGGWAVLVKPSFLLAIPAILAAWLVLDRRRVAVARGVVVALGVVAAMGPWWVRNGEVFGRFVPTAIWSGASLYDGLNPGADGSSDMRFLGDPRFRALGEVEQDRAFSEAAWAFARSNPARVARLAVVKAGRFWSPWPNADSFRSIPGAILSASFTLPLFALLARGVWACRKDARALVLMGGPLAYFFALHVIFVSSIRYRIPPEVPAFGLMAAGWMGGVRASLDESGG